jgi:hypothetical protein
MVPNLEDIKDELTSYVESEISDLADQQLVQFNSGGKEYIYARQEEDEYWSVPAEELDGLKNLMTLIRQFDKQIDNVKLDEATATKFISRYYRMRSDAITLALCLQVDLIPHRFHLPEQRCSVARVEKAREKIQSIIKTGVLPIPPKVRARKVKSQTPEALAPLM